MSYMDVINSLLAKIDECGVALMMSVASTVALWVAWTKERRARIDDLRRIARLAKGRDDDDGV